MTLTTLHLKKTRLFDEMILIEEDIYQNKSNVFIMIVFY